jgi:hypothetical protein
MLQYSKQHEMKQHIDIFGLELAKPNQDHKINHRKSVGRSLRIKVEGYIFVPGASSVTTSVTCIEAKNPCFTRPLNIVAKLYNEATITSRSNEGLTTLVPQQR